MNNMENQPAIYVSEVFCSLQGEGLRLGHVSYFLRVFGCNLRCPNFGMKVGDPNTEIQHIIDNIDQYKSYKDLPLSHTGCDSYPSSYPQFKRFSQKMTSNDIIQRLRESREVKSFHGSDLVITGGEPLLKGTQKNLVRMMEENSKVFGEFNCITFETNGTQSLTDELIRWLSKVKQPVIFSISPKLTCSGVERNKAILPGVIDQYKKVFTSINQTKERSPNETLPPVSMYLKFVVNDEGDLKEVEEVVTSLRYREYNNDVYIMSAGGCYEEYSRNMTHVANTVIQHNNYIFSPREHVILFKNTWGA